MPAQREECQDALLTQVKVQLGLSNVTVYTAKVQEMPAPRKFDVITSRAFADLSDFAGRINPRAVNKRASEALIKSGALDTVR